jgi:hypothetical protein
MGNISYKPYTLLLMAIQHLKHETDTAAPLGKRT